MASTTTKTTLKYFETWRGTHRGITYEVCRSMSSGPDAHPLWTFYIYLRKEAIPEEHRTRFFVAPDPTKPAYARYDWGKTALADLDNWHHGMTFYSIEAEGECVKAGCDYNHYWDEGHWFGYNVDLCDFDAKALIDELHTKHPYLLVRCNWNGKYYPPSEVEAWGDGFISKEGIVARDESKAKSA